MLKSLIHSKTGLLGALILVFIVFLALTANLISPHNPFEQDIVHKLLNPVWTAGHDAKYFLGTDQLGRDVLSRLIYGSRVTLMVAFSGTVVAGIVGVILGCISGYYGGRIDAIVMRIADIQLSFPFILLALFIAAVLGSGLGNVVLIVGYNMREW